VGVGGVRRTREGCKEVEAEGGGEGSGRLDVAEEGERRTGIMEMRREEGRGGGERVEGVMRVLVRVSSN